MVLQKCYDDTVWNSDEQVGKKQARIGNFSFREKGHSEGVIVWLFFRTSIDSMI